MRDYVKDILYVERPLLHFLFWVTIKDFNLFSNHILALRFFSSFFASTRTRKMRNKTTGLPRTRKHSAGTLTELGLDQNSSRGTRELGAVLYELIANVIAFTIVTNTTCKSSKRLPTYLITYTNKCI